MATITTFKTNALPTKTVGTLQLKSKIPTATQTKPVITTVARPVVSQQAATEENVKLDIIKQTSKPASSLISWVPEKQETAVQTPTTATQQVQTKPVITTIARPVISQQTAIKDNVTLDIIKQTTTGNPQTEYTETTYTPSANFGIGQNLAPHPEPEQTVQQQTTVQTSAATTQQPQTENETYEPETSETEEAAQPEPQTTATDDKKKKIIFIIIAVIAIWLLFFKKD